MKNLLILTMFISHGCHGQIDSLTRKLRFHIEVGTKPLALQFTELTNIWGYSDYSSQTQLRIGIPFNLVYINKYLQLGAKTTVLAFGPEPQYSNVGYFFVPNDFSFHLGFNIISLYANGKGWLGPFLEIGIMTGRERDRNYYPSLNVGIEGYLKKKIKMAVSFGYFQGTAKELPFQMNNFFSLEVCYSFSP